MIVTVMSFLFSGACPEESWTLDDVKARAGLEAVTAMLLFFSTTHQEEVGCGEGGSWAECCDRNAPLFRPCSPSKEASQGKGESWAGGDLRDTSFFQWQSP